MVKLFCNRCGKEIEGTTYYTIYIEAKDIKPTIGYSSDVAIQNISNQFSSLIETPMYCKECICEIKAAIENA